MSQLDTLTDMKFQLVKFNPYLCKYVSKDSGLFYQGYDFVILADESDLQWFAKELNEALIVEVRGVLGGDEGGLKEITLFVSYHAIRTDHEWLAFLGVGARPEEHGNHHRNAWFETCRSHQHTELTRLQ